MSTMSALCFGPYRLSGPRGPFWREQEALALRPKALEVLWYLASHAGEVIEHGRLLEAVWPKAVVSEGTLAVTIGELRRVLDDDARQPRYILTVHRQGYRFIAPVEALAPCESFPVSAIATSPPELPGRSAELEWLEACFTQARAGQRQMVFITGEPGIGKSALLDTWLGDLEGRTGVLLGRGQCVEHYGGGEAYLALLEALSRLCRAPGGEAAIEQLRSQAPGWLAQLWGVLSPAQREHLQRERAGANAKQYQRELADALEALSAERVVVLVLEDLHWSDHATTEALAVLARRPEAARLLVIGTYRPVELIVREHPLKALKQELQQHEQCQELALQGLDETAVRVYVERFLPPAEAGPAAALVYRRTAGQPLFMVNLTEYLVKHTELTAAGCDAGLAEAALPDNLRRFIEVQFERLDEAEQQVLEVASVVGVVFTGAAVAVASGISEAEVDRLCGKLARRGQFIAGQGVDEWPDGSVSERYAFRHALYPEVLYQRIGAGRRIRLHRAIGERLEAGHGTESSAIAVDLAEHFEQGRDYHRAVRYYEQSAATALSRCANRMGAIHLRRALALLDTLPRNEETLRLALRLHLQLGATLIALKGQADPEVQQVYQSLRHLCLQGHDSPQLFWALVGLRKYHIARAEVRTTYRLSRHCLALAREAADPALLMEALYGLGNTLYWRGFAVEARRYLEQSLELHARRPRQRVPSPADLPADIGSLIYLGLILWQLGYPEQALRAALQGARLAAEMNHPFSRTIAHIFAAKLHKLRREPALVQEQAEQALALASRYDFIFYEPLARFLRGWALEADGRSVPAPARMQDHLAVYMATGVAVEQPYLQALAAQMQGPGADIEIRLRQLHEAQRMARAHAEGWCRAELWRVRGELLLQRGTGQDVQAAEACFRRSLADARRRQTRAWELRAATSLARLWAGQGRKREARELLAPIHAGFTEGLDTADLRDAAVLLDELA